MLTPWKVILFLYFDVLLGLGYPMFGNGLFNEDEDLLHALLSSLHSPFEPTQSLETLAQPSSSFYPGENHPVYQSNNYQKAPLSYRQPYSEPFQLTSVQPFHESRPSKRLKSYPHLTPPNVGFDSFGETHVKPFSQNTGFHRQLTNPSHFNSVQISPQDGDVHQLLPETLPIVKSEICSDIKQGSKLPRHTFQTNADGGNIRHESFSANLSPASAVSFQPQSQRDYEIEGKTTTQPISETEKSLERQIAVPTQNFMLGFTHAPEVAKNVLPVQNFFFTPTLGEVLWIASLPLKSDPNRKRAYWVEQFSTNVRRLNFWVRMSRTVDEGQKIHFQLQDLGRRLWDLHTRSLIRLGNVKVNDDTHFEKEQAIFLDWLSTELKITDHATIGTQDGLRQPIDRVDWNHFVDALRVFPQKDEQKVWSVSHGNKQESENIVWVVYEQQFYATRAAIQILATYFKTNNSTKWRQLFYEDERFIRDFLKDFRLMETLNGYKTEKKRKEILKSEDTNVFPWAEEVENLIIASKSLLKRYNSVAYQPHRFNGYIKLLKPGDRRVKYMFQNDELNEPAIGFFK
ncbi:hypothetical protein O181_061235 [Austropuccinia psidii MF-1]|uniref:Uncharacterized protein n=1 Tax=Austropuccinia psidii MF-1 TaxID=1389203 RepID=A0A9Q3EEU0_9BASI|nr:hypothetical protein [Austropuccinia psidii MF-1]